jgi:N-acetylglucosaminyldiphosphoundecaprenol N-acetyl-beta-D-mannosaminyltransferase
MCNKPYSKMKNFEKIFILGVSFTDATETEVLEFIITGLGKQTEKYYIVTPNPELLVIANGDKEYKGTLNGAKLALPDGIGVMMAAKLLGVTLRQRIHGVDLVESLCREVSNRPITVGFLGAGPSVAEMTSECLIKKYPGLRVGLVADEWSESLKDKKIDILFVAFGSPKQEMWIANNLSILPAKVVIGVGGAFDFISGRVPRAPIFLRSIGLEWLFRLIIQPWRIKRQLSLIRFVILVIKEKIKA